MYKTKKTEIEQHVAYQDYILQIFHMSEFDATELRKNVDALYDELKTKRLLNDRILSFLSKKAGEFMSEDVSLGFMLMYSYDTAYEFHTTVEKVLAFNNVEFWDLILEK